MSLSADRGRQFCFAEEISRRYFHHKINLELQVHLTVSRHPEKHLYLLVLMIAVAHPKQAIERTGRPESLLV